MIARYALVVGKLQWSRARESAEISDCGSHGIVCSNRFNGAALVRARRSRTPWPSPAGGGGLQWSRARESAEMTYGT